MPKKTKIKLPQYVIAKGDDWYVRLSFPTLRRTKKGHIIYTQVVRKCEPKSAERAQEIVDYLRHGIREAQIEAARMPTLREFLDQFLQTKASNVSRRTNDHYLDIYEGHIKEMDFAQAPLSEITPEKAQRFLDDRLAAGVSADMIHRLHSLLSMAFRYAVLWKRVNENPMTGLLLPKVRSEETLSMTPTEAKRFLEVCKQNNENIIFEFALETGLRPQECLALSWSDLDLINRRVRVRKALVEGVRGGGLFIEDPKTETSKRTVSFSQHLAERLLIQQEDQAHYIVALKREARAPVLLSHKQSKGVNYKKRQLHKETVREILKHFEKFDLVFPASNGKPQSRNNLNRRHFKELLKKAGIDPLRYSVKHLRHTNASMLAAQVPARVLQKRLGHASVVTTLRFYTHVQEEDEQRYAERFADMFLVQ